MSYNNSYVSNTITGTSSSPSQTPKASYTSIFGNGTEYKVTDCDTCYYITQNCNTETYSESKPSGEYVSFNHPALSGITCYAAACPTGFYLTKPSEYFDYDQTPGTAGVTCYKTKGCATCYASNASGASDTSQGYTCKKKTASDEGLATSVPSCRKNCSLSTSTCGNSYYASTCGSLYSCEDEKLSASNSPASGYYCKTTTSPCGNSCYNCGNSCSGTYTSSTNTTYTCADTTYTYGITSCTASGYTFKETSGTKTVVTTYTSTADTTACAQYKTTATSSTTCGKCVSSCPDGYYDTQPSLNSTQSTYIQVTESSSTPGCYKVSCKTGYSSTANTGFKVVTAATYDTLSCGTVTCADDYTQISDSRNCTSGVVYNGKFYCCPSGNKVDYFVGQAFYTINISGNPFGAYPFTLFRPTVSMTADAKKSDPRIVGGGGLGSIQVDLHVKCTFSCGSGGCTSTMVLRVGNGGISLVGSSSQTCNSVPSGSAHCLSLNNCQIVSGSCTSGNTECVSYSNGVGTNTQGARFNYSL